MKKIISGCVVGLVVGLVGCASPSYNTTPKLTRISAPPEGVVTTVGVGDQMVTQGTIAEDDALIIGASEKVSGYTIHAGQYNKTGENEKGKYFSPISTSGMPIAISLFSDPYKVIMVNSENELCVVTVFNAKGCKANVNYEIKKVASTSKDAFQQTLIYSGKVGNKINIGYREFSNDTARPAFNNNVEYDLNESKQIGYKGALLDIINATNQSITYKVIKNFNANKN